MRDLGSLKMGEIVLHGGVGIGMNQGCSNMFLTIPNHARENAAVSGVFLDVSGV